MFRELDKAKAYASGAMGLDIDSPNMLEGCTDARKREFYQTYLEGKSSISTRPDMIGNNFAAKSDKERKESTLYLRVTSAQKASYVEAEAG